MDLINIIVRRKRRAPKLVLFRAFDFSQHLDGGTATNGTALAGQSVGGFGDCLRYNPTAPTSDIHSVRWSGLITPGTKITWIFDVWIPQSNDHTNGVRLTDLQPSPADDLTIKRFPDLLRDQWHTLTATHTFLGRDGTVHPRICMINGSVDDVGGASAVDDYFAVRNMTWYI